ncbi:MAG: hypothetical protein KF861_11650, partial [Planctomycetaceae bacterium]|nr:hypothetical protein [Planctomycetaceae bacterium]
SRATSQGQSVKLECELSDDSLRRILSLIITPATPHEIATPTPAPTETTPRPRRTPSRRGSTTDDPTRAYVDAVNRMINDLQWANRRATDYARTATWHDNFARKIGELPTEGVDRQALTFGQRIASSFRALAASLRGQAVEVNTQQKTLTYDVHFQPGWAGVSIWGAVGYQDPTWQVTSNLREVRERQAAAIAAGNHDREQIWLMIEEDRVEVERALENRPPNPAR